MKVVSDFEFRDHRSRKYDWDQLLNGEKWEIDTEKDLTITVVSFRARLYQVAKERGKSVRTLLKEGKLYVQAYEPGTNPDEAGAGE